MIWIREMDQEDVCRSNTQRNYAPFTSESNVSAVSPRAFAFLPTSSRTSASDAYSPIASSRIHRLNKASILRFSAGAADSYARAVSASSGIGIVTFCIVSSDDHSTAKNYAGADL